MPPKKVNITKRLSDRQLTGKKISQEQAYAGINSLNRISQRYSNEINRLEQQVASQRDIVRRGSMSRGPDLPRQRLNQSDIERVRQSIGRSENLIAKYKRQQEEGLDMVLWDDTLSFTGERIYRPPPPPPSGGAGMAV